MNIPQIDIDEGRWDSVIKPFIIVNGSCLYVEDGYITNNGIQTKVEFYYQSVEEIEYINFEEAIGAIKHGRVGIGDANENHMLQDNESISTSKNEVILPTSSVNSVSGKHITKPKKVVPKILAYGKDNILSRRRPMPKSKKGLTISPDTMKLIGKFAKRNTDFIRHNGQISADTFEKDDKYFTAFLYKLQPLVKIADEDLFTLKQKYDSKAKKCERTEKQTDHEKNISEGKSNSKFMNGKNKSQKMSKETRKIFDIHSTKEDFSISASSSEEMEKTVDTEKNTNSKVSIVANESQDSMYKKSSDEETESEDSVSSRKKTSKLVQNHIQRAYSVAEDRAIINYVLKSRFLNQVNGNVLWKELQNEYHALTNRHRSWHSLRNRFMKSIRLNMRDFHLSINDMNRLRMATFKGTVKKPTPAIILPLVISAHSRRNPNNVQAKATKDKEPKSLTEKGKPSCASPSFNTVDASTPQQSASKKKYPTYSNIVKMFEAHHRADMDSDSSNRSDQRENDSFKSKSYPRTGSRKLLSLRK